MEFALRTTAVITIAIQKTSDVALMPRSDPMHQPLFVVAVALIAFAVFQKHVMTTLVLLTLLKTQECNAWVVPAVSLCVARGLALLISVVRVTHALTQPLFALGAFAVLPRVVQ
jgi:hypothetical protein